MAYHSALVMKTYHECKNCTVGNDIEARNLRDGKPTGATLCQQCADKQRTNTCTLGTPTPAK